MRTIMIGLATALLATQAAAQSQTAGFFAFRGEGERGWEATCTLQRVGGRTLQREMTGPRDAQQVIAARSIIGGRCEFRASTTGPLTLEFDDTRFQCPFTSPPGTCGTVIAAGQSGAFDVRIRN